MSKVDRNDSHSSMPSTASCDLIDELALHWWMVAMEFIGRPMRGRFLVRQGSIGWMVYDSELKGPAQIEKDGPFAEKLTKQQAEFIAQALTNRIRARSDDPAQLRCVKAAANAR
ncbi:hypothetical protein [Bradyrhizobium australafricanum]|uniref:hypothetical protein n=1 Tax=Bradyrhizobium australafricanum TaxID=2821406 RepID=UPI001CE379A5|nr:hypothetical protein [Bradyrhizobium australafricanum]